MKIFIHTLGCRVNQLESQGIADILKKHGHEVVSHGPFDVCIINSCSVTSDADKKARNLVRKYKKMGCIVALCGCYPQTNKEALEIGADIVIGNGNKKELVDLIENKTSKILKYSDLNAFEDLFAPTFDDRFQKAYLKIEDGCTRFCSYCIIPFARGPVRSLPLAEVKRQAEILVKNGYKEIVLTGINLSYYGVDIGCDLGDALCAINDIPGDFRIRFGSLEPDLIDENMISKFKKCEKLCHHFHLALQSGSNKVLNAMNRKYTREQYIQTVNNLRDAFPLCSFTTDVMVGFCYEEEEDFNDTVDLINQVGFLRLHVFIYSPRPGTKAYNWPRPKNVKARADKLIALSNQLEEKATAFYKGKPLRILAEANGFGYSDEYLRVPLPPNSHPNNFEFITL